jgi:hypothetical protein
MGSLQRPNHSNQPKASIPVFVSRGRALLYRRRRRLGSPLQHQFGQDWRPLAGARAVGLDDGFSISPHKRESDRVYSDPKVARYRGD